MKEGLRELEEEQERIQHLISKEKKNAKQNEHMFKTSGVASGPMKMKVRFLLTKLEIKPCGLGSRI